MTIKVKEVVIIADSDIKTTVRTFNEREVDKAYHYFDSLTVVEGEEYVDYMLEYLDDLDDYTKAVITETMLVEENGVKVEKDVIRIVTLSAR